MADDDSSALHPGTNAYGPNIILRKSVQSKVLGCFFRQVDVSD
jgi:hypothetical protein